MRANCRIVQGDFLGGEIEPGTFHDVAARSSAHGSQPVPDDTDTVWDFKPTDGAMSPTETRSSEQEVPTT
jgi:hypothetical protein